jgi:hypothetical protein
MTWLFDASEFMPRSMCGPGWTLFKANLDQICQFFIGLPYLIISLCLLIVWFKIRMSTLNAFILVYFFLFIFLCGITHFCNILAFHYPAYNFFITMDCLTAVVSTITATMLPFIVLQFIREYKTFADRLQDMLQRVKDLETLLRK